MTGRSSAASAIAVLIACHNRRSMTLHCLEHLSAQDIDVAMRVFLVDDGSTDGTTEAVREHYPEVQVIAGNGDLYWNGGMRLAFEAARSSETTFTHYLWLNDDTRLHRNALRTLLETSHDLARESDESAIVVGSTRDPRTGRFSYGGFRRLWPLPFIRNVQPAERPVRCGTFSGNCVLVPQGVVRAVGNLDPGLTHARGDIDYGWRAAELGFPTWVAPGFLGVCEPNPPGSWRNLGLPLQQRLESLKDPRYAYDEKVLVARRHYGLLWFLSPLALIMYIYLSHPIGLLSRRSKDTAGSSAERGAGE